MKMLVLKIRTYYGFDVEDHEDGGDAAIEDLTPFTVTQRTIDGDVTFDPHHADLKRTDMGSIAIDLPPSVSLGRSSSPGLGR
ncbi:hypothetical protein LWI28_004853 [Acer negundo]|uniref:Uncharacterized protein n=1 Tax=Acer negundo TaxID=4023 RepID=A0AAD5I543_ACENE|nr:hypothetical protein LWI28_004853 [Acer negundo]